MLYQFVIKNIKLCEIAAVENEETSSNELCENAADNYQLSCKAIVAVNNKKNSR